MVLIFLLSLAFCVYTYAIFPLLLHWRASARKSVSGAQKWDLESGDVASPQRIFPKISIVIAAHNEAARLPAKLANLQTLDYPKNKLQIIVVSDGSTDGTVDLMGRYPEVTFDHYVPAAGKPTALNRAVELCTGDILVYMDARQLVSGNTLVALVNHFSDPLIGAVSGELVLSDNGKTEAVNVGLYWRYEKWIRQNESVLYSTTGATGALYAIRRTDAVGLPADTLLDDFVTPISILGAGKRTVFEPTAQAFDQAEEDSSREFRRKVRTLAGNYQAFARHTWLFSPIKNPVWWQFLSHKVFRLLVPYAMALAFLSSALGSGMFLALMFWGQVLFYTTGVIAIVAPSFAANKVSNLIKVFLKLNAAAVVGAVRFYTGRAAVRWKTG